MTQYYNAPRLNFQYNMHKLPVCPTISDLESAASKTYEMYMETMNGKISILKQSHTDTSANELKSAQQLYDNMCTSGQIVINFKNLNGQPVPVLFNRVNSTFILFELLDIVHTKLGL